MMPSHSHKWVLILSVGLTVGLACYGLKHRSRAPALVYQAPNLERIVLEQPGEEPTKLEEYEAILAGKKAPSAARQKKRLVRFGLARLFKPRARAAQQEPPGVQEAQVTKASRAPRAPTYFFTYSGEAAAPSHAPSPSPRQHFFKARVYNQQQVRDRSPVVVKVQEPVKGLAKPLPAGTLLFGEGKFAQNRLKVTFSVAQWQEERLPVVLHGYDQDLLLGLAAPGLAPSVTEKAQQRLARKALSSSGSGLGQELGQGVVDTWHELKKKKVITLEDRRVLYVRLEENKQR